MLRRNIAPVKSYDVGDRDVSGRTDARLRGREMFAPDVAGECRLSSSTIICAASCAFAVSAVLDEPHSGMGEPAGSIVLRSTQPQVWPFASTRHSALISSILRSVV
jgi:hypothetical protein